ncbi:MAG: T9SS type A sorting domain-containing protein [Candidatus Eiseniibacteriota bacterium]|nr:MAG: T9SS type A sorting domain-containing protein [Candidatus Eisenbacteria bacterium]
MCKATLSCLLLALLLGALSVSGGAVAAAYGAPAAGDTTVISYGDYVEAIIGLDGEVDVYLFDGLAGDSVTIQMHLVSGTLTPRMKLFAPNDSLVKDAGGTTHTTIVDYSLPYSGTYKLLASDYAEIETGNYWVSLQCRQHVRASADTIVYDSVTDTLAIDPYGDMDAFVFVGDVGDSVIIKVHRVSGTFYPELEVFSPAGSLVEIVWGSGPNQRIYDFSLPDSGSYTLFVSDHTGDRLGEYWVSLQCRQHVRASADVIVYDSLTDGLLIDMYGDMDAYAFEGAAGDSVIIQMHKVSGGMVPKIELFAPNDGLVEETGGSSHETIVDYSLPYSGTYMLFASDNAGDETGEYWLTLQCRQHVRASADTIAYDSVTDTLSIDPYGDLDAFVFTGDVGDSVIIQVHRVSGTFYPQLELFAPDGGLAADVWGSGPNKSISDFALPDSGSYTLFVSDYYGYRTGDYWVSLQCRQQVRATADTLVYDSLTEGLVIDPYGDLDAYVFDGAAGDSVIIQMHRVSGSLAARLELFAPNDSLVEETGGTSHETIVDYQLPYSGTYTLFARDNAGDKTGEYWLTLQCRQHVKASADTIVYDSVTDPLLIDQYGDLDAFVFVGDVGDSVIIQVHRVSGTFYPRLELFGPNDSLVKNVWGAGANKRIEDYPLPDSGSYTLFVSDYTGDKTGEYWVSLQCRQLVRASADTLLYDSFTDGLFIDPYGDMDAYVFAGTEGDSIIFQMHRVSGGLAPRFELLAPNDSLVAETGGASHESIVDYQLPYSGIYTVFASDNDGDETGEYWLTLQCRQLVRASADTIVYDSLTDPLAISPFGDLDAFVFEGSAGDLVIIQMHRVSGTLYPRLELLAPNDSLVKDVWGSAAHQKISDYPLPYSGTYLLYTRDYTGDRSGDYWLSLQCRQQIRANADTLLDRSGTIVRSLEEYGDMKAYLFPAIREDTTDVTLTKLSGDLGPCMELYGPSDTLIVRVSGYTETRILDSYFTEDGLYTLFVCDKEGDGAGSYELSWSGFFRGGSIGVDPAPEPVPQEYRAHQSFPNPFNPLCTIRYDVPKPGRVTLRIFDVSGSLVRTLVDSWREPGTYREVWNGRSQGGDELPSGVYFYCLEAHGFSATRKMVLLK